MTPSENAVKTLKVLGKIAAVILAAALFGLVMLYYRHGTIFPELGNSDQPTERRHPWCATKFIPPIKYAPKGVRLAPEGVLFVTQRFAVATAYGVHGFREGTEVRLIKEEGNVLVVSDGTVEGRATKDHFTNDLDEAGR